MKEFTIKEAAEYINKSESWIRKKILNNEIPAEKKAFKYGQRYKIKKDDLDNYLEHIQAEKEVIELTEVNKPVSKEVILNELTEVINKQNKALIDDVVDKVADKIEEQQKAIKEDNKVLMEEYKKQQEFNKKLVDEIQELKKLQKRTIFDKIKDYFT